MIEKISALETLKPIITKPTYKKLLVSIIIDDIIELTRSKGIRLNNTQILDVVNDRLTDYGLSEVSHRSISSRIK